jgi:hypothetical protein
MTSVRIVSSSPVSSQRKTTSPPSCLLIVSHPAQFSFRPCPSTNLMQNTQTHHKLYSPLLTNMYGSHGCYSDLQLVRYVLTCRSKLCTVLGFRTDYRISFGVRIETQLTICGNYISQLPLLNCSVSYCHTDMVSNCKQGDGRIVPFLPYIWASAARQLGLTNGQLM